MISSFTRLFTAGVFVAGVATAPFAMAQEAPIDTTAPVPPASTAEAPMPYLTVQGQNQISASTYLGQTVYNSANESIGTIDDLIITRDGGVDAAIIGVGGFLGLGQKNVAVPFENITVSQQPETNDFRLTTTETANSLRAAPEFKTLRDQAKGDNSSGGAITNAPTADAPPSDTTPAEAGTKP